MSNIGGHGPWHQDHLGSYTQGCTRVFDLAVRDPGCTLILTLLPPMLPQNIENWKLSVKMHIFFCDKIPLIRGFCVCYGQAVSVLGILCPSWTVCVFHNFFLSSTINIFLKILGKIVHEIWVCPRAVLALLATLWSPASSPSSPHRLIPTMWPTPPHVFLSSWPPHLMGI